MQKIAGSRFHKLDEADLKAVRIAVRIIEEFRDIESRMPTSYAHMFLAVARAPGAGPTEYAKAINTIQPVASRLLLALGPKHKNHPDGLELVDRQTSPDSMAKQEYYLTDEGFKLARKIVRAINGD